MTVAVDLFRSVSPSGWEYDRFTSFAERSAALVALPVKSLRAREHRAARWTELTEEYFPESESDLALLAELAELRQAELVAERDGLVDGREARVADGSWRASDGRQVERLDRDIAELLELRTVAIAAKV